MLNNKLFSEKIATLMLSSVTVETYTEPNTGMVMGGDEVKKLVSNMVDAVNENNRLHEVFVSYRFLGCTILPYQTSCQYIRVETFYNGRFYEPYHISICHRGKEKTVLHSIPDFISVDSMVNCLLPNDMDLFIRAITELLTAYVSSREQFKAFRNHANEDLVDVSTADESFTTISIKELDATNYRHNITLIYDNLASIYPTQVEIDNLSKGSAQYDAIVSAYKCNTILHAHTISH
ncbi:hypothetical protein BCR42DRAFT_406826 [Absidia repens]|uniref:Cenp-O kinetochore centromere component-domain-containing protein n=1 Tax=Absidia repens TaxID=90262 RepID=A0A1X2IRD0_9FUNG|nr:hypothetical protein BCR42DRAFT_406826 [Absidia repens]